MTNETLTWWIDKMYEVVKTELCHFKKSGGMKKMLEWLLNLGHMFCFYYHFHFKRYSCVQHLSAVVYNYDLKGMKVFLFSNVFLLHI